MCSIVKVSFYHILYTIPYGNYQGVVSTQEEGWGVIKGERKQGRARKVGGAGGGRQGERKGEEERGEGQREEGRGKETKGEGRMDGKKEGSRKKGGWSLSICGQLWLFCSTLQCPSHSCRNPRESTGILRNPQESTGMGQE